MIQTIYKMRTFVKNAKNSLKLFKKLINVKIVIKSYKSMTIIIWKMGGIIVKIVINIFSVIKYKYV